MTTATADLISPKLEQFRRTRSISRGLAAVAVGRLTGQHPDRILRQHWQHDHQAALIAKAAVTPTAMADVETASKWLFLSGLTPQSGAVRLFSGATRLDMDNVHLLNVSSVIAPSPVFVGEGKPMPMMMGTTALAALGPVRKMLLGTAVTGELEFAVPETASTLIGRVLSEQAGKSLDAVLFDAIAADDDRPAGLLNGVAPIAAAAGLTTAFDAAKTDLANLAAALATAGCDPERMVIVANSSQALALRLMAGPRFTNEIIGTTALATGTVVAIDPAAIASGYSGVPEIEISEGGTAHFESATPLPISTAATPNTVAAPVLSAWQENLLMLKVRLRCCWGVLVPGAVQVVQGVTW
ncbi:hypothetical protein [Bradyrhizobium sp. Bra64]|uniref:hypothetical protein n=1 Tax=Bradyrhizobium sp. Bra64 TaxID=2926009 RepID=UPI00211936A9|nr:hypothetical protein [Bradyrhizobium sp. Bra64]